MSLTGEYVDEKSCDVDSREGLIHNFNIYKLTHFIPYLLIQTNRHYDETEIYKTRKGNLKNKKIKDTKK